MKILELFAGKQCFSNVAKSKGHTVFTSDILALDGIDYPISISDFDPSVIPFIPDVIWCSPECKAFSVASGGFHFRIVNGKYEALTDEAKAALQMVDDMLNVINHFLLINPNLIFYIENPVGLIDKVTDLKPNWLFCPIYIPRCITIDQCAYGRDVKKPTLIFTNDLGFKGKKCEGDKCTHFRKKTNSMVREGSYKLNYYGRAALPNGLCEAVLNSASLISQRTYAFF